jgi:hypothetical protein
MLDVELFFLSLWGEFSGGICGKASSYDYLLFHHVCTLVLTMLRSIRLIQLLELSIWLRGYFRISGICIDSRHDWIIGHKVYNLDILISHLGGITSLQRKSKSHPSRLPSDLFFFDLLFCFLLISPFALVYDGLDIAKCDEGQYQRRKDCQTSAN